ncbi:MAG: glycosyltransferase [Blastocatellia bacterium]|nr:glycosyltransferase [Blastocatellia bacterium]
MNESTEAINHEQRPRFSMVIPAYNEQAYIPRLLDSVERARDCYIRGASAIEVIVADNASTDSTPDIARERGCRVVRVDKRVIAASRNGGAAAARGEILCFIDADSQIHPETFNEIDRALRTGKVIAGATGVRLERWSLGLAMTYAVMMPMALALRIDAGVVFCRREDFERVGGYNEGRLFAEDVQFLWELRKLGRKRSQRLTRVTSAKAIASTRKFDKHGEWHYFTQMPRLAILALKSSTAATDFAKKYWYEDNR